MARKTRIISVVNPKGGCGKTTIATGLAAWLAYEARVALVDLDRQQSAFEWLQLRNPDNPHIAAVKGSPWPPQPPPGYDYVIVDAPAGIHGKALEKLVLDSHKIIVPLLASPIDMRTGWRYLDNLFRLKKSLNSRCQIGLIGNRVKTWTLIYRELTGFIDQFKAPFVGHLRESVNYIHAMGSGLGVGELPYYKNKQDLEHWQPLVDWVRQ